MAVRGHYASKPLDLDLVDAEWTRSPELAHAVGQVCMGVGRALSAPGGLARPERTVDAASRVRLLDRNRRSAGRAVSP
jgi:hypothetical protein